MDWPEQLLTSAVRWMPAVHAEWGAAMRAELAHLQLPRKRWQFAVSCVRVAIFPPGKGGFLMNDQTKRLLMTSGMAALFSLMLVAPFAILEIRNYAAIKSSWLHFPFLLFGVLWFLPTAFFLTATPIVRGFRAGENILAHPVALLLRIAFLAFVALSWIGLVRDQMPCFLGVPNCD